MPYSLSWLPSVLLSAGLKVAEQPGWLDRGQGDMGRVQGVICHHTGTPCTDKNMPTLRVLVEGRSDLAGPLAQLGLGRDGTFYVVAAGRAFHAGAGAWRNVTGNSSFIGIEGENSGAAGDPWPDVQMDAYRRGVAAILTHVGADAGMCCGHREYAPRRKTDPTFDMDVFRKAVQAFMGGSAAARPLIPAATSDDSARPTLRRGARGEMVVRLQDALHLDHDGVFGPNTEAVLRRFQRSKDLVPDGIAGPKTWAAL